MGQQLFSRVQPTRFSGSVVAQLRSAILSGRLRPGDRLPTERELAEQFGVSRITIRDALRTLEAQGLVVIKVGAGGGPYVNMPDISVLTQSFDAHFQVHGSTFEELAEARIALETMAARLAAERATEEDLKLLEQASQAPTTVVDGREITSIDFHAALVRATKNGVLWTMFMAIRPIILQAIDSLGGRTPERIAAARKWHGELYAAIARGDGEAAEQAMRAHLLDLTERAVRARKAD